MNKRLILGVSLLLFSVIIGSQLASSDGSETIPLTVTIADNAPIVGEITCTTPVTLNESSKTRIVCTGDVVDQNGWQNIVTWNGTLVLNSSSLSACNDLGEQDNSSCYLNRTCTSEGESGNKRTIRCNYWVWWYTEATSDEGVFSSWFNVTDGGGNRAYNLTSVTINDLLAINVTDAVDFGSLQVSDYAEVGVRVNNTGNVQVDLEINATNMTCSGSTNNVTPQDIAYNTSTASCGDGGGTWTDCCTLNGIPGDECPEVLTNFDLNEDATGLGGDPTNHTVYLTLYVPAGVAGTCDGFATFYAVKG